MKKLNNRCVDFYRECNGGIEISIDDIAKKVININYGVHQMLSALVREGKERRKNWEDDKENILVDIEKLLNIGKM